MKKTIITITSLASVAIFLVGCNNTTTPASVAKNLDHNLNVLTSTVKKLDSVDNSYLANPDIYPASTLPGTTVASFAPNPHSHTKIVASAPNFKSLELNLDDHDNMPYGVVTNCPDCLNKVDNSFCPDCLPIDAEYNTNYENLNFNTSATDEITNHSFTLNADNVQTNEITNSSDNEDKTVSELHEERNYHYFDYNRPINYQPRYLKNYNASASEDYLKNYMYKVQKLYAMTSDVIEANTTLENNKNDLMKIVDEIKELNNLIKDGTCVPTTQQLNALNNYIYDIKTTIKRIKDCNGQLNNEINSINRSDNNSIATSVDVINSNYIRLLNHIDTRITYLKNALATLEQVKYLLVDTQEYLNSKYVNNEENKLDNNTTSQENQTTENVNLENTENLTTDNSHDLDKEDFNVSKNNNQNNIDMADINNNDNIKNETENVNNNKITNIDTYKNNQINNESGNIDSLENNSSDSNINTTNTNVANNNLNNANNTGVNNLNNGINNGFNNGNGFDNNVNYNNLNEGFFVTENDTINTPNGTFQNGIITQNNLNTGVNNGVNGNVNGGYNNVYNNENGNIDTYRQNTLIDMLNNGTVNNGINTLSIAASTDNVDSSADKPTMVNGNESIVLEEIDLNEVENNVDNTNEDSTENLDINTVNNENETDNNEKDIKLLENSSNENENVSTESNLDYEITSATNTENLTESDNEKENKVLVETEDKNNEDVVLNEAELQNNANLNLVETENSSNEVVIDLEKTESYIA